MRIDSTAAQPQRMNELLSQQQRTREAAGEKENDGGRDDMMANASVTKIIQTPATQQATPQGVGTKVDILA